MRGASAAPTDSSSSSSSGSSGPSAKTSDRAKPKKQRASKPRKPATNVKADDQDAKGPIDTPSSPRTAIDNAIDNAGAKLRTTVRDALNSLDPHRPGSADKNNETVVKAPNTTNAPAKRRGKTVERLIPDAGDEPDVEPQIVQAGSAKSEPKAAMAVAVEAIATIPKSTLATEAPALAAITPDPVPKLSVPPKVEKVEAAVTGAVATVINTVLNPISVNSTPGTPADPPAAWAMLAFARREFEHVLRQPQDLLTQVNVVTTAVTATGPVALAPGIVVPPELAGHVITTPGPSLTDQIMVFGMEAMKEISKVIGVNITMKLGELITTPTPPWFTTIGVTVTKDTYAGGDVWVITPPNPTGERVIAVPGSGFIYNPNIMQWMDYTQMARDTGATVIVARYPLIPDGGNAENTVPPMADFIADQVETYGAENVSIYADSAGGTVAALAVQKIVRDCNGDSACLANRVPSRMVLLSPGLEGQDIYTDPNVALVNDPVVWLTDADKAYYASWATGPEELWNPMIGPIEGMPPTTIYVGSREQAAPGALLYAKRIVDTDPSADVTVVIGMGQIHDWALGGIPINSQSANYRDDIYRQLGIVSEEADDAESVSV